MDTTENAAEKLRVIVEDKIDRGSVLNSIATILTVLSGAVAALFFVPSASYPFAVGKTLFVALPIVLAFILWIVTRLREGQVKILVVPVTLTALAVLLATLLSALFSGAVAFSFIGSGVAPDTFVSILFFFLVFALSLTLLDSKKKIFTTYLVFFAVFAVLALFQILRVIWGPGFLAFGIFTDTASNLIGKWNDLGVFLGAGILLSIVTLELLTLGKMLRVVLSVTLSIALILLAVVNFTTVWIALAVMTITFLPYLIFIGYRRLGTVADASSDVATESGSRKRRLPLSVIIVLAVSILMLADTYIGTSLFGWQFRNQTFGQYISAKAQIFQVETRPSWGATFDMAKATIKTDPIFGAGPNRFSTVWLQHKPQGVNLSIFWGTDFNYGIGLLPTSFVTTGILGFLAWLSFILAFLTLGAKVLLAPVTDKFSRYLSVSSFFSAVLLWIFFIFYIPGTVNLVLTFFFSGLFVASAINEKIISAKVFKFADKPKIGFLSVIILVALLLASVTIGSVLLKKASAASRVQKALIVFNTSGNVNDTENLLLAANKASVSDTAYRFLSELSLVKINQLLSSTNSGLTAEQVQTQFKNLLGDAVGYAQSAVDQNNTNYQNWISFGRVYEALVPLKIKGAENAYRIAADSYGKALTRNPHDPEIYLMLARLEVANQNNKKAREYLKQALQEKENYTEAIFFLSQIEVQDGNLPAAITQVESVALLSPNDPTIHFQLGLLKYNTKDYKGAATALERAIALNPVYANAKYFLGLVYDKLGREADAIKVLEEVKSTNSDNKELGQLITNIKAGRDPFTNSSVSSPEKGKTLPVKEGKTEVSQ